jgi:glycosyltransferase involved in cell wall biosynthesis
MSSVLVSIIVPTYNGARRIRGCLEALCQQSAGRAAEVLVVNDGSTDDTAEVVAQFPAVKLINQANAGPAAARNRGAQEARGRLLLFTDDDCVPTPGWLDAMLVPFRDAEVVGAKGIYRTLQKEIVARFVQVEYEDRYRIMSAVQDIDFVDTYSAGFVRERFLEMNGYDTSFPVACAEDVELSYRMSARGWKMRFHPEAVVHHLHPNTLSRYLKKKYKFAFWRVLAVRNNPSKGVKDSHTPQIMKLQLLFLPALLVSAGLDLITRRPLLGPLAVIGAFLLSTLPFVVRALRKDIAIAVVSPLLLAARACAQVIGITGGLMYAWGSVHERVPRTDRLGSSTDEVVKGSVLGNNPGEADDSVGAFTAPNGHWRF